MIFDGLTVLIVGVILLLGVFGLGHAFGRYAEACYWKLHCDTNTAVHHDGEFYAVLTEREYGELKRRKLKRDLSEGEGFDEPAD